MMIDDDVRMMHLAVTDRIKPPGYFLLCQCCAAVKML